MLEQVNPKFRYENDGRLHKRFDATIYGSDKSRLWKARHQYDGR